MTSTVLGRRTWIKSPLFLSSWRRTRCPWAEFYKKPRTNTGVHLNTESIWRNWDHLCLNLTSQLAAQMRVLHLGTCRTHWQKPVLLQMLDCTQTAPGSQSACCAWHSSLRSAAAVCTGLREGNQGTPPTCELSSYSHVKNNLVISAASLNK